MLFTFLLIAFIAISLIAAWITVSLDLRALLRRSSLPLNSNAFSVRLPAMEFRMLS